MRRILLACLLLSGCTHQGDDGVDTTITKTPARVDREVESFYYARLEQFARVYPGMKSLTEVVMADGTLTESEMDLVHERVKAIQKSEENANGRLTKERLKESLNDR